MEKIFKYLIFTIIIILLLFIIISNIILKNSTEVKEISLLSDNQQNIDNNVSIYDYTLNNPLIVNNPYIISPLTSLVIFDTLDYCSPKITVYSKDIDNLTYYYKNNKHHSLIIYGLYPDYENKVKINCNKEEKELIIKTKPIEVDLNYKEVELDNELNFIKSNYLYAVDKNNDLRWILLDNFNGDINILDNNHLVISSNKLYKKNEYASIVEMNLLGKIYNEYFIPNNGNISVSNNNIYTNYNNNLFSIDRQTGEIKEVKKDKGIKNILLSYINNDFKIKKLNTFNNYANTEYSKKNINLVNTKKIDKIYKSYKIKLNKHDNRLIIKGNFKKEDEVYLILDKTFDKKIIKLNNQENYIYNNKLSGRYNIYLYINNIVYNTKKHITFDK